MLRRLGSALALLALLGGTPWLLLALGYYGWSGLNVWAPADYRLLLALFTLVGWGAWGAFALSAVAEGARIASGGRIAVRLPGLRAPQALAGGLLTAILVSGGAPLMATAAPASPAASATVVAPASRQPAAQGSTQAGTLTRSDAPGALTAPALVHVVRAGEDLWSLAERYYGDGSAWRRIAAANADVLGPDPTTDLAEGTPLAVTDPTVPYLVQPGDTLWHLAELHLGEGARYPELLRLNASRILDPDYIEAGWTIRVPDASVGPASGPAGPGGAAAAERGASPAPASYVPAAAAPGAPARTGTPTPGVSPVGTAATAGVGSPSAAASGASPSVAAAASGAATGASGDAVQDPAALDQPAVRLLVGGLAALAASGVLGGLLARRRERASVRPLGRTLPGPDPALARFETALGLAAAGAGPGEAKQADETAAPPLPIARTFPDSAEQELAGDQPAGVAHSAAIPGPAEPPREALVARALRLLAAYWTESGRRVPRLRRALLTADHLVFEVAEPLGDGPEGFEASQRDPHYLRASWAALGGAAEPGCCVAYPGLVTLGRDAAGDLVMVDLFSWGAVEVTGADDDLPEASLAALLVELGCAPWASELELYVATDDADFVDAVALDEVRRLPDAEAGLTRLERLNAERRAARAWAEACSADLAGEPEARRAAPAFDPVAFVFQAPLSPAQVDAARSAADPALGLAAVFARAAETARAGVAEGAGAVADGSPLASAVLTLERQQGEPDPQATFAPTGQRVSAQTLPPEARRAIAALYEQAATAATLPAAWWREDDEDGEDADAAAAEAAATGQGAPDAVEAEALVAEPPSDADLSAADHPGADLPEAEPPEPPLGDVLTLPLARVRRGPRLRLFGAVRIEGAEGEPPAKAPRRCLEYLAWLLEHPGATASAMTSALFVTDGTRRSNLSRLRAWLGQAPDGSPFLPEAYSGRLALHAGVTSDWAELRAIADRGVNTLSPERLRAALDLVDGAPLADAAPGEWAWADALRREMAEVARDVAVVLARAERSRGDLDAARRAVERGRLAAPDDELLLREALLIEADADRPDAARSLLRAAERAAAARCSDLQPETVRLAQEVLEGRPRPVLRTGSEG